MGESISKTNTNCEEIFLIFAVRKFPYFRLQSAVLLCSNQARVEVSFQILALRLCAKPLSIINREYISIDIKPGAIPKSTIRLKSSRRQSEY